MDYEKKIEIPFGAYDSELCGFEYTIPEGMDAEIKDGKVIVKKKESEDERIRKFLLDYAIEMIAGLESDISLSTYNGIKGHDPDAEEELSKWQKARAYLEKQKDAFQNGVEFGIMQEQARIELEGQKGQKHTECLKPEKGVWYKCINDFYAGGKKCASRGDLVQAKAGMYMMGREDISEWFRKAYYDEVKPAISNS